MAFAGLENATKPSLQALIAALDEVCKIAEWASPPQNKMEMVGTIEECLSHIIEEKGADEVDAIQAEDRSRYKVTWIGNIYIFTVLQTKQTKTHILKKTLVLGLIVVSYLSCVNSTIQKKT